MHPMRDRLQTVHNGKRDGCGNNVISQGEVGFTCVIVEAVFRSNLAHGQINDPGIVLQHADREFCPAEVALNEQIMEIGRRRISLFQIVSVLN